MNDRSQNLKDGIVVVNKPAGMSSARVVSILKKTLNVKKAGHTGTLDPFATGVMVCGINKGTKLSRFFLHDKKKYTARLQLGIETDTLDVTGEITGRVCPEEITDHNPLLQGKRLHEVVSGFKGTQMQTPPVYSALKHNGVPLYKLARMGTPVTKPPRQISIFSINITDIALPFIGIEVECSAGTYIRVLASDIGKKLGFGAHLVSLERIECCGYDISGSYTPEDLKCMDDPRAVMVPMSCALPHMEKIIAGDSLREKIRFGRTINCDEIECGLSGNPVGDFIRITDSDDNLLAIVRRSQNIINYCCVFHC